MTEKAWLEYYDAHSSKFKWFVEKYFRGNFEKLENLRLKNDWSGMTDLMNDMWFRLPDSKFNIMENPEGWDAFICLLESPPDLDVPVSTGMIG